MHKKHSDSNQTTLKQITNVARLMIMLVLLMGGMVVVVMRSRITLILLM